MAVTENIIVPRFYVPRPHQREAWLRRRTKKYHYDFLLWCRQAGKDTDLIEDAMDGAWKNPGMQIAYIGLDNVWITNNIFKKVIDGRKFWSDYPAEFIEPKDTQKEVLFKNNPEGMAESRIKFIGFLNDEALIGSSYDRFYISEGSLYPRNAFQYLEPIWENKLRQTGDLFVSVNGTPRGVKNNLYDMLKEYTGVEDPKDFPGEHGDVYVQKITCRDLFIPDGSGGWKRLYSEEDIEKIKDRHMRAYGNLNLYYQEYECEFGTVNAGLVYQGVEQMVKEGRVRNFNIDTSKPMYVAFDISSKGKTTDATSAVVYQFVGNSMFIYDQYEARGKALVECIADLSVKPYFRYIRMGVLPWDSDRSASSKSPIEEAQEQYPNINWHALDKERVDRGIQEVRRMIPNMFVHKDNCDRLMDCFMNYEYKRLEAQDDWAPKPNHNQYSHLMDALRYAVMGIKEIDYFGLNAEGGQVFKDPIQYETQRYKVTRPEETTMGHPPKVTESGFYYY